jgi:transposase-like protein
VKGAGKMKRTRKKYSADFKAKVALEALKEQSTIAEISRKYKIHATVVHKWKRELLEKLPEVFSTRASTREDGKREAELLKKIGQLTMERDFLANGLDRIR